MRERVSLVTALSGAFSSAVAGRLFLTLALLAVLLAGCAAPDLNAPMPNFETGVDPSAWAQIPAGEFLFGQHEAVETTEAFEMMVTDVTVSQYTAWLTEALASGAVKIGEFNGQKAIVGFCGGVCARLTVKSQKSKVAGQSDV